MDLNSDRVTRLGGHLRAKGIDADTAANMNEHEARHHMSQVGIVNIPHHEEIWSKAVTSLSRES